jgi:hypothetical protein
MWIEVTLEVVLRVQTENCAGCETELYNNNKRIYFADHIQLD